MKVLSYIVHLDLQVSSAPGEVRKMEGKEEDNKLISADSPEVLNVSHPHCYAFSLGSLDALKALTEQDVKLACGWFLGSRYVTETCEYAQDPGR